MKKKSYKKANEDMDFDMDEEEESDEDEEEEYEDDEELPEAPEPSRKKAVKEQKRELTIQELYDMRDGHFRRAHDIDHIIRRQLQI